MSDESAHESWVRGLDGKWYPPGEASGPSTAEYGQPPSPQDRDPAATDEQRAEERPHDGARPTILTLAALVGLVLAAGVTVPLAVVLLGSGSTLPAYESGNELVAELERGGAPCVGANVNEDPDPGIGPTPIEKVSCEIDGEYVEGGIYSDAGALDNYLGMGQAIGCEAIKALGMERVYVVIGEQWELQPQSETVANHIAEASGGDVRQLC